MSYVFFLLILFESQLGNFLEKFWEENLVIVDWETATPIGTAIGGILGVRMYQSTPWLEAFLKSTMRQFIVTEFEDLESLAYTIHSTILTSCGAGERKHTNDIATVIAHRRSSHFPSFIQQYLNMLNEQRRVGSPDYNSLAELLRRAYKTIKDEEVKEAGGEKDEEESDFSLEEEEAVEVVQPKSKGTCGATVKVRVKGKFIVRQCRKSAACPNHRGGK